MSIFECLDYRQWFKIWLKKQPKGGHGELSKIARHLNVNSTLISQVLSKKRDFSLEQGYSLCRYFSFNELETRFFIALLQIQRAGDFELKKYFEKELAAITKEAGQIKNRVFADTEINDTDKSFLVSTWKPAAILVFTGKEGGVTKDEICDQLGISKDTVDEITERLVDIGLAEQAAGTFKTGFKRLHIPKGSSFLLRHYSNWRLKAIAESDNIDDDEVMYTSVSSISKQDIPRLKKKILDVIADYAKSVSDSPAEQVVCFNLDFFKVK